ncbi:hypothetical protein HB780_20910 [Rhizobium lusitanum]|uniref:hypothetical protein n=1 Tax=Rhizobium lusitanum TaxID=293958 RepID=UPI0016216912|nr:hypothetical protein [Rhizobium lusitanum]QND48102.1 hypothetical protein HB780_20910 [Rhizobium lusitanum]
MNDFSGLLEDLKTNRSGLIDLMINGQGWTDTQVRQLAEIQGAIAAVEAEMAEPPKKKTGPKVEFGPAGWPVTLTPNPRNIDAHHCNPARQRARKRRRAL